MRWPAWWRRLVDNATLRRLGAVAVILLLLGVAWAGALPAGVPVTGNGANMETTLDWQSMVNVNLTDHEVRLNVIESVLNQTIDFDDMEYTWEGDTLRQVQQYSIRTAPERQAARLDNHDQRLRAIEHRLLSIEVALRDLHDAIQAASGV